MKCIDLGLFMSSEAYKLIKNIQCHFIILLCKILKAVFDFSVYRSLFYQ